MFDELVELPNGWGWTTIREIAESMQNGIYKPSQFYSEDGIACLRMYNIENGSIVWKDIKRMNLTQEEIQNYELRPGDILVNRVNSRELVGKAAPIPLGLETCTYESKNIRLRLSRDFIESKFVGFWFRLYSQKYFTQNAQQTVGMASINQEQLGLMPVLLPPLNEQRCIVAKIEALKARSQQVKEALEVIPPLLDQFRQSVLAAAFRGDLTADWREQNPDVEPASVLLERIRSARQYYQEKHKQAELPEPSALPKIPSGWLWVTVEHLGIYEQQTVLTGPFGATLGREDFLEKGVPVITIGCLQNRGLNLSKAMYISQEKANELQRYKLKAGDFLFSRMASVGRAAIVEEDLSGAIFNYHLMRLRLSRGLIEAKYFLYYVRGAVAVSQYVKDVNHGATRDGINTQQLSKMPVALPSLEEQRQIIQIIENYFDTTHNIDDFVLGSLEELQVCNQSILAKAFRGELVPQDPNDEPASVLLERIRAERAKREVEAKAAKKSTSKTTGQRIRKAKQQDSESIQLGLPGVE